MNPKVSVVMPVYNTASYLEEAIDSILVQSFGDFELIAVNDGSTDACADILERYQRKDSRVRVIHQQNSGISATRNTGLRHARGRYIAVMDSDDISHPDRLAKQVALMDSRPDVGLCGTRCSFFGDDGQYSGVLPPADPDKVKSMLLLVPTLSNTSLMMRHDLILTNNFYYDETLPTGEDYDLSFRLSLYCKITNLPDILMRIRVHGGSTTRRTVDGNDRWMSVVHRRVLSELGIDASEDELAMHLSVSTGTYCLSRSRAHVEGVERWFCKLMDANDNTGLCDPAALETVLFERWCLACLLSREPLSWKLTRVRNSRLYKGHSSFLSYCFWMGANRALRQMRRRLSQGGK